MKIPTAAFLALTLSFAVSCANNGQAETAQSGASHERTMVGQILLPAGSTRRGTELHATVTTSNGEILDRWLLFDKEGYFAYTLEGVLSSVTVTAGGAEVYRIEVEDLPETNQAHGFDIGIIDLRALLKNHRLKVRAAEGASIGEIRVAMWFGLPPVGPEGGRVSLGSKQFPTVRIGSEEEWLVPFDTHSIYFLVERQAGSGQSEYWRSGRQTLFGPFTTENLPTELVLE